MLVDQGRLLLGGVSSQGDIHITMYDLQTGKRSQFVLHPRLEVDDHNVPALLVLPDGRYLAAYTKHGSDKITRFRVSSRPGDISAWEPEQHYEHTASVTYSNLCYLAGEGEKGRIYNFVRSFQWDPNFIISEDGVRSWRQGGRLLDGGGPTIRPYLRYKGNGKDTIHFIATDGHPSRQLNSIYHGYIRGGKAYRSDGICVNENIFRTEAPPVTAFTRVFQGDEQNVAWTVDIELDEKGRPYILYSVMKDPLPLQTGRRGMDHRYHYARWDGNRWHAQEIAYAGTRLYPEEPEYTGLAALHPKNPNLVFISTNAYPDTGQPILVDGQRRYEIFRGQSTDGGRTWQWRPVTSNSSEDNLRPLVAAEGEMTILVWLRGHYRSYTNYKQAAVGLLLREKKTDSDPEEKK